jgi:FkbM family methyltransferase
MNIPEAGQRRLAKIAAAVRAQQNNFENSIREQLFGYEIFAPIRTTYQFIFNRQKLQSRRRMRSFYAQHIHQGDLVFDIGANVGIYTEIFTELGARVVAVEPNPSCYHLLERLSRCQNVIVVPLAAGDKPGTATLQLSSNNLICSTNADWLEATRHSPLHNGAKWIGKMDVETTTLDILAQRYGVPSFVKIDVEGSDDRVLAGMSLRPPIMTFEFNRLVPNVAMRCLEQLQVGYEFNYIRMDMTGYGSPKWLNAEEFSKQLSEIAQDESSGDVIARRMSKES